MHAPTAVVAPVGSRRRARRERIGVVGSMVLDRRWTRSGALCGTPVWTVRGSQGGVARNVAENMARLGADAGFVGLGEPGPMGAAFADRLTDVGVAVLTTPVADGVGRFDCEISPDGDLLWATIHLPAADALSWSSVAVAARWLREARAVLVETGLPLSTVTLLREWTTRNGIPLWGLPTRVEEVGPRWDLLRSMDLLVLNQVEAAALLGDAALDPRSDALALTRRGVPAVIVTTGADGAVCASADGSWSAHPAHEVTCVDATGAGDAFVAGLAVMLAHGEPWAVAVDHATAVAAVTVGCGHSTCARLSRLERTRT